MRLLVLIQLLLLGWTGATSLMQTNFDSDYTYNEADDNDDKRIVGGYPTFIRYHKHLVLLFYFNNWACTGSLVTRQHVVSAAHCVDNNPNRPNLFSVKAGTTRINGNGVIRRVVRIWMHPKYNKKTLDADIAVLKLIKPVRGSLIAPIPLATNQIKAGQMVKIAGWGLTTENGNISNRLRAIKVPVVSRQRCSRFYQGGISSRMICGGADGKGICQGDSGGAVVWRGRLVGVASGAFGCARPRYPSIFANVLTMKPFIKSKLRL